jgi:hypothetical protein
MSVGFFSFSSFFPTSSRLTMSLVLQPCRPTGGGARWSRGARHDGYGSQTPCSRQARLELGGRTSPIAAVSSFSSTGVRAPSPSRSNSWNAWARAAPFKR